MNVQLVCYAPGIRKRLSRQEEGRELNQAMVACFDVTLTGANNIFFWDAGTNL